VITTGCKYTYLSDSVEVVLQIKVFVQQVVTERAQIQLVQNQVLRRLLPSPTPLVPC
jgi:hypothetical protein